MKFIRVVSGNFAHGKRKLYLSIKKVQKLVMKTKFAKLRLNLGRLHFKALDEGFFFAQGFIIFFCFLCNNTISKVIPCVFTILTRKICS